MTVMCKSVVYRLGPEWGAELHIHPSQKETSPETLTRVSLRGTHMDMHFSYLDCKKSLREINKQNVLMGMGTLFLVSCRETVACWCVGPERWVKAEIIYTEGRNSWGMGDEGQSLGQYLHHGKVVRVGSATWGLHLRFNIKCCLVVIKIRRDSSGFLAHRLASLLPYVRSLATLTVGPDVWLYI